jgi:hypothetical protein
MMNMSEENSQVEDDVMKISDLGGSMNEVVELNMDELTVLEDEEVDEDVVDRERENISNLLRKKTCCRGMLEGLNIVEDQVWKVLHEEEGS